MSSEAAPENGANPMKETHRQTSTRRTLTKVQQHQLLSQKNQFSSNRPQSKKDQRPKISILRKSLKMIEQQTPATVKDEPSVKKKKPFIPISQVKISPSRQEMNRCSQIPSEQKRMTFREAIRFNVQQMQQVEKAEVSDGTTALDFKVAKIQSPTWQHLKELQIHDQEDLTTPQISCLMTQRPVSRIGASLALPMNSNSTIEQSLVERIEKLENELKSLQHRVAALEPKPKKLNRVPEPTPASRCKRKYSSSLATHQRKSEHRMHDQSKDSVIELKRTHGTRQIQKAISKVSQDISDIGHDSDIDEVLVPDSPSNVIDRRTKANALPNHDQTEREARAVKQIVPSQVVSPILGPQKSLSIKQTTVRASVGDKFQGRPTQTKHTLVQQSAAHVRPESSESSEELFQCLTQRQSFTEQNTGKSSQVRLVRDDQDQDANGGQDIIHPTLTAFQCRESHLPTDDEQPEEHDLILLPVQKTKEVVSIELLQNNARLNALTTILNQDNNSFSEFKEATQNLLRQNSSKSFGETSLKSLKSELTSLSSKIVLQKKHQMLQSTEPPKRDVETRQSNCYGVQHQIPVLTSQAFQKGGMFKIIQVNSLNADSFGLPIPRSSVTQSNMKGSNCKSKPDLHEGIRLFSPQKSSKFGHSASSDRLTGRKVNQPSSPAKSNIETLSQMDQCNIKEDNDASLMEYFARRQNNLQAQKVPQITNDPQTPQKQTDLDGAEDASDFKSRNAIRTTKLKSCEKETNRCFCTFKFNEAKDNLPARMASLRQSQHLKESTVQQDQVIKVTICGDSCVNMPPDLQNRIVTNILKQHSLQQQSCAKEKQKDRVLMNIICAKWWHQWCDYTSFRLQAGVHKQHSQAAHSFAKRKMTNGGSKSSKDPVLVEIQKKKMERYSSQARHVLEEFQNTSMSETICESYYHSNEVEPETNEQSSKRLAIYQACMDSYRGKQFEISTREFLEGRPNNVSNWDLIDVGWEDQLTLKEGLMEHYDYEVILPQIWKLLVSWYGCSDWLDQITHDKKTEMGILRPLAFDKKTEKYFIDLYLEQNNWNEQTLTDKQGFDPDIEEEVDQEQDGSRQLQQE